MSSKKNILVLSPFFYPEPISTGKFNTDFVKGLINEGHKITILCFHPFYPAWKVNVSKDLLEGVRIIRGGKMKKITQVDYESGESRIVIHGFGVNIYIGNAEITEICLREFKDLKKIINEVEDSDLEIINETE